MPTRREQIALVLQDGEITARGLADLLGLPVRVVVDDLEHVRRSHRRAFTIRPAECFACGFRFRDRARLTRPSRCPACRSERIDGPWLSLPTAPAR